MKKLLIPVAIIVAGLVGWIVSHPVPPEIPSAPPPPDAIAELESAPPSPAPSPRLRADRLPREEVPTSPSLEQSRPPQDLDETRQWARENPAQALSWLENAPAGPQRDTVAEIACAQVAETDPSRAVQLAERYAGTCTNLIENMVFQWSERDEPQARAYALAKPAGEERDRLLARVALSRAKENPAEAAKFVVSQMSAGETQNEAVMSVLHQWALRDPDQALAWAQLFPESALRTRALTEIENLLKQHAGE